MIQKITFLSNPSRGLKNAHAINAFYLIGGSLPPRSSKLVEMVREQNADLHIGQPDSCCGHQEARSHREKEIDKFK